MHHKSRSKIAPSNSNRRKQALCHQRSRLEGDNGLFHSPIVVHVLKKGNPCLHVVGIQHIIEHSLNTTSSACILWMSMRTGFV